MARTSHFDSAADLGTGAPDAEAQAMASGMIARSLRDLDMVLFLTEEEWGDELSIAPPRPFWCRSIATLDDYTDVAVADLMGFGMLPVADLDRGRGVVRTGLVGERGVIRPDLRDA